MNSKRNVTLTFETRMFVLYAPIITLTNLKTYVLHKFIVPSKIAKLDKCLLITTHHIKHAMFISVVKKIRST